MQSIAEVCGGTKIKAFYADPPWAFETRSPKGKDRSPEKHYHVPNVASVLMLSREIAKVRAPDSACFMWVTMPQLKLGITVLEAWGFNYKTCAFSWMKTNKDGSPFKGLGFWTRANTEICLLGTFGNPRRISKSVGQAILAPKGHHSAKPPEIRDRIRQLVPGPYLELYARKHADGWLSWGDQLPENVIPTDSGTAKILKNEKIGA